MTATPPHACYTHFRLTQCSNRYNKFIDRAMFWQRTTTCVLTPWTALAINCYIYLCVSWAWPDQLSISLFSSLWALARRCSEDAHIEMFAQWIQLEIIFIAYRVFPLATSTVYKYIAQVVELGPPSWAAAPLPARAAARASRKVRSSKRFYSLLVARCRRCAGSVPSQSYSWVTAKAMPSIE